MSNTAAHPTKKQLLESLLAQGLTKIVLDARRPGVAVPERFRTDPQLVLNLSWKFDCNMVLLRHAVHANLTFDKVPFPCSIPWGAIYLIARGTKQVFTFPADAPAELRVRAVLDAVDGGSELTPPKQGHLRLVK